MEPGQPPHVVNTVTEKVISSSGVPEHVITTVTDKKFSESGKPDKVTTTVTEKVFTEKGVPSQMKQTTVTETMSSCDLNKPVELIGNAAVTPHKISAGQFTAVHAIAPGEVLGSNLTEQVTTVADTRFSEAGKPEEVTTTVTERLFSEEGVPTQIKQTTVTEKLSADGGQPVQVVRTVITETSDDVSTDASTESRESSPELDLEPGRVYHIWDRLPPPVPEKPKPEPEKPSHAVSKTVSEEKEAPPKALSSLIKGTVELTKSIAASTPIAKLEDISDTKKKLTEKSPPGSCQPESEHVVKFVSNDKIITDKGVLPPETIPTAVTQNVSSLIGEIPELTAATVSGMPEKIPAKPEEISTSISASSQPGQRIKLITEETLPETGMRDRVTTSVTDQAHAERSVPADKIPTAVAENVVPSAEKTVEVVESVMSAPPAAGVLGTTTAEAQAVLRDPGAAPGTKFNEVFTMVKDQSQSDPDNFTTTVTQTIISGPDGETSTITTQRFFSSEVPPQFPLLDEEFLRDTPKVTVVTKESTSTSSKGLPREACYVTTPTMQRRAHSQRRTNEDRPAPIDVSHLQDEDSDDEGYIVTEPTEDAERQEDRFRINSSPEILLLPHSSKENPRRSPDQNRVKFQLGSLDSQESTSSDPTTPVTPVTPVTPGTKVHKFTVERVEEEKFAKVPAEGAAHSTSGDEKEEDQEQGDQEQEEEEAGPADRSSKLRRIERHFERMASQSLAEGTTPVQEVDFQRVVSQLSREEVALSEDEYENLLMEAATPSDEWDSQGGTDESPEALEAAMFRTASVAVAVPERAPLPTFLFSQSSDDRDDDVFSDSDEEPTPPHVPTSVFWSFDDRPVRTESSLSLDELGLPLTEPSAGGEALSHWANTDHLDRSVEEPALPAALPRVQNRSASVVEELLLGYETIPAPIARSVLRSTCFPGIPEAPFDEQRGGQEPEATSFSSSSTSSFSSPSWSPRTRSPVVPPRESVPLNRSPLGLLFQDRLERTARQFADGLGDGREGSEVQPPPPHPHPHPLPTPRRQPVDNDDDDDPDSEPAVQEKIKPYSERRAFWEQVASSGSAETPTTPLTTPTALEKTFQTAAAAPVPGPRHVGRTESVDSESEYLSRSGRNAAGCENDAFVGDDDSAAAAAARRPARMHSVEEYGDNRQPPPVAVRKAIYERSISLPCADAAAAPDAAKRKRQFEDHLKKELVAENLLQQLEEEALPEHKDLPNRREDSPLLLDEVSFETDPVLEGHMRRTAEAIVDEAVHNAEAAVVHRAEEHVILEPQEEALEWHGVRDLKDRFEGAEAKSREHAAADEEKTNTEIRRESLARTHELTNAKLAEVMQFKGENRAKPSDSLEVHVDKSETEDTEKSRDLDEDIKELENQRRAESRVSSAGSKGTRGQSSSEDTQCESDVTPEEQPEGHSLYQPQQQIQDIVWEVGVQDQPEPMPEEFVQDILVPSGKLILQNGDLDDRTKEKLYSGVPATVHITEEEARKAAEELVHDIEQEVSKRNIEPPIIETIRQIAEEKNLEKREIELMESLLAKKHRDQSHLFSRTDTTTSSMEITDEDLRSSGVEIDLSPTESQSGLYHCMDPRARQEDEKPEALRSEDIDLSDLKPDPIHVDDTPNDRQIHKNFSVIEESDECDTRSDHSDAKTDSSKRMKHDADSIDEIQKSLDAVNEELDEEFVVKDVVVASQAGLPIVGEETTVDCSFDAVPSDCLSQGSPTGSTTSSGGKRTPPPKPERKSRESTTPLRDSSAPEIALKFDKAVDRVADHVAIRAESVESQRSSSQDEKSPMSGGEAAAAAAARDAPESAAGVVRRRPDGESSSSGGDRSGGLHPDRRSGADLDPYSSSSESHYHSFEQSYSRPCSSDVEGLLAVTTGSSEYESAVASARSATSADYQTAVSSLSSRESMKSLDSESSGHLASVEVSSEASETLVPSATDLDDMDDSSINLALDDELERRLHEHEHGHRDAGAPEQRKGRTGTFPTTEISDDDVDDTRDQIETDEEDEIPLVMKRSQEMTFHPEPKAVISGTSSIDAPGEDKLASSMDGDTASVLSMSISSASDTLAVKTVIELSRTDSDKMDASGGTSELLTASATSQDMSGSSESREEGEDSLRAQATPTTADSGTSTPTHQREGPVSAVTLTTATVAENGVQSACTQVTSESAAEPPRRSHRRHESTSSFAPFVPPRPLAEREVNASIIAECVASERAESEAYYQERALSPKESADADKKSADLEESYQTEADQAFHREAREARYLSDDVEPELEQLDGSRPHSQVSKSDSESGQRAVSSGFSDERADSELAEVLRQGSSDTACEDMMDRPLTPEPAEEIQIKPDEPEFSTEALASVSAIELEYGQAHAFGRTVEYASHVSPLKDKPCVAWEHPGEHEDDMAEAEAAFHMVPHHSPHHGGHHHHAMPETILEDEDAEKNELDAREAALREQRRRREEHMRSISPANIPDITVTEHMAPIKDKDFQYPDLEKDADVEEAPLESAVSSRGSTTTTSEATTDTSQGREYVVDESVVSQSEASASTVLENKARPGGGVDSVTESPTSESFEMLEKPGDEAEDRHDICDDFEMIEEVGREARECDTEGVGVRISSAGIPIRKREQVPDDDDEFVAQSPPPPTTRIMDVKYYGEGGVLADEDDPFRFEGGHEHSEQYEDNPCEEFETEAEVEAGKKWIEMQFGGEEPATVTTAYNYEMDFERGPLEDIKEEDEMGTSSKIGSLGSQKESVGSFGSGSVKESLSSTPEYDVLAGKKYFTRSGEHDDISMSSLQEFESLETQIALDAAHKRMKGSQDSLNGAPKKRMPGDDVSLASLQEFEKMERVCVEAERIELRARVEEALLSEIDEGHESQVSDSDETISGAAMKTIGDSDSDDYDKRMFEIDEIIRQAQSNVERFDKPSRLSGGPESFGRGDSLEEVARVPDLEFDAPHSLVTSTDSLELRVKYPDSMVTSADSLEVKVSPSPQMLTSADSIDLQQQLRAAPAKADIMTDSIEQPTDPSHMITSSDSLELETTLERGADGEDEEASLAGRGSLRSGTGSLHDRSSSSGRDGDLSSSSALGACGGARRDPMLGSTDSLEPTSSTATHATYQYETDSNMSSSFTSGGSNTMVSSTETLEASACMPAEGAWYEESVEASDDPAYSHVIKRVVQAAPEVRKVTFRGPASEAALRDYVERFGPGDRTVEEQRVDADGSVHMSRVVQHRVVVRDGGGPGGEARTDLTGPELEDYLQRHGEETPAAIAHPLPQRRPPPSHDISVDDDPEYDVREHDWRFNLQHSAEAPDEEETDSVEEKQ